MKRWMRGMIVIRRPRRRKVRAAMARMQVRGVQAKRLAQKNAAPVRRGD
jgi:hypothetical protein